MSQCGGAAARESERKTHLLHLVNELLVLADRPGELLLLLVPACPVALCERVPQGLGDLLVDLCAPAVVDPGRLCEVLLDGAAEAGPLLTEDAVLVPLREAEGGLFAKEGVLGLRVEAGAELLQAADVVLLDKCALVEEGGEVCGEGAVDAESGRDGVKDVGGRASLCERVCVERRVGCHGGSGASGEASGWLSELSAERESERGEWARVKGRRRGRGRDRDPAAVIQLANLRRSPCWTGRVISGTCKV